MADDSRPRTARERLLALLLTMFVAALAIVVPVTPAEAAPLDAARAAELCTVDEWKADFHACVDRLADVTGGAVQCVNAPTPDSPDSGLGGWFASRLDASRESGYKGYYVKYGYAGYSFVTYDQGCLSTVTAADSKFENTVANGELMLATGVIGASNALRERAWDPGLMWGWADPLVEKATQAIYTKVFTVFGAVTLCVVGLYLLWRSRQAEMSAAMTTAGWALLVMIVVTALAAWPTFSAHLADKTLISSLAVVHDAVGPPSLEIPADECTLPDKTQCQDPRPPAVRASDTAVDTMLYRNWLRGLLGSSDSVTAQKYGEALYDAHAFSWIEAEQIKLDPNARDVMIQRKNEQWLKVAQQIRTEDPEAYEYLRGNKGMERIGAGFIALLSSIMFALFDLVASLLVLLGFLIFRWAVIAAPILGTVALLRPASAGFRRLLNAVVAAIFNIVIFGTGAAIYLYAVDLVMTTVSLPGWLQVVLVWLCGVVGWLLLRPYRRITQLGGRDATAAVASPGGWHRRFFRDVRQAATLAVALPAGEQVSSDRSGQPARRNELRSDVRTETANRPAADTSLVPVQAGGAEESTSAPRRRMPAPSGGGWSEPDVAEPAPSFTLYRPGRSVTSGDLGSAEPARRPGTPRAEARQD